MKIRIDHQTALIVDAAVKLADTQGAAAGANVLARNAVPLDVAHRVLLRPAERRIAPRQDDPVREIQRRLAAGAPAPH